MQEHIFTKLREIVIRETGIALSEDKKELLTNRLGKRLRALKLVSETDYLKILETEDGPAELLEFIDAISTNVTHFFREEAHFQALAGILQEHRGEQPFKIWCAGCSTGEEPYCLAMTAAEIFPDADKRCLILATDISRKALRQALAGSYSEKQVNNVPRAVLARHFLKQRTSDGVRYTVSPLIRSLITFRRLNLSRFPYPLHGPFHAIFCRNVMIYFDADLRGRITSAFEKLLAPGGHLFIGHSENLLAVKHQLKSVQPSVFRKTK